MAARQRLQVGSIIRVTLADSSLAYIQYIGDGFYGDAVRVLPGRYRNDLSGKEMSALSDGPERFVTQTMIRLLLKMDGVAVLGRSTARPVPEIAPAWLVTPASKDPQKQWVAFVGEEKSIPMPEYRRRFPNRETDNLPGTGVLFPERLRSVLLSEESATGQFE